MRMVPLRQVAELVETTSPQIIKRQDLQRRVAHLRERRRAARRATSAPTCRRSIKAMTLPPGYRFDVGGPGSRTCRSRSRPRSPRSGSR